MQNDIKTESQTAFMGTSCLFTLCHNDEHGMAPSLENAYTILIFKKKTPYIYRFKKKMKWRNKCIKNQGLHSNYICIAPNNNQLEYSEGTDGYPLHSTVRKGMKIGWHIR